MSDGNISFIIAIASSIGLISSEILPFIPIKGNGILHSIFFYLSKLNERSKKKEEDEKDIEKGIKDIEKELKDIEKELLQKLDNDSLLIKQIKNKVDEIYLRIV